MSAPDALETVQELAGQTTELSRPGLQPTALSSEAKGSERRGVVSRSRYVSSDGSTSSTTLRAAAVPARSNSREVSSRAKVSAVPPPVPQVGAAGLSNKRRSAISQLFHRQDDGDQRLVINTPPSGKWHSASCYLDRQH